LQPSETLQADVTVNSPPAHQTHHRIRLSGIVAPDKAQPYGLQSRQSLSDLVVGRMVTAQTGKTDC
jgi:endonuclease YncB( thermonuclease family)